MVSTRPDGLPEWIAPLRQQGPIPVFSDMLGDFLYAFFLFFLTLIGFNEKHGNRDGGKLLASCWERFIPSVLLVDSKCVSAQRTMM